MQLQLERALLDFKKINTHYSELIVQQIAASLEEIAKENNPDRVAELLIEQLRSYDERKDLKEMP